MKYKPSKKLIAILLLVALIFTMEIAAAGAQDARADTSGGFPDVPADSWYSDSVDYAVRNGLMNGMEHNTFQPNTTMTRAMLVTVLWRQEGSQTGNANRFTDVPSGTWYTDAVAWANAEEIVNGTTATEFSPEDHVTREQMVTILYRYAQYKEEDTTARNDLQEYPDAGSVSNFARTAMQWAVAEGIINGSNGNLLPRNTATRAEVATILYRYFTAHEQTPDESESSDPTDASDDSTEPTEPSSESTEPSGGTTEPTEPSSEPTEPSSESTEPPEPTTEPTQPSEPPEDENPVVYMTTEITPEAMVELYEAMGVDLTGNIAIKLSTGEPPNSNYLRPELIGDLVRQVGGTIVECNTAYGGSRSETAMHYQVAEDHGFTDLAPFVIMDENGSIQLPVEGGDHLTQNYVGAHFADFDSFLVLSHFKGHAMAGFGGAIKNISIGIASQEGKCLIHTAGRSHTSPWGGDTRSFLESMGEAGKSVVDVLDGQIVYISVMNRLSIDCDCDGNPAEPDIHDIGILASTDPVALDQACVDLIYQAEGNASFVRRMEGLNAVHVLEHAEEIGLGSRTYTLTVLDE